MKDIRGIIINKELLRIGAGFLTGVLTGFISGILFAPDKGKKTRRKIARGVVDWEEDVEQSAARKLKNTRRGMHDAAEEIGDMGKNAMKTIKDKINLS